MLYPGQYGNIKGAFSLVVPYYFNAKRRFALAQAVSKTLPVLGLSLPESWEVPFEEISELQWVGSGAQGAVFLGKFHGEDVAVKKVRDIKETEIKHLRKLKHPNIITFK